MTSQRQTRARRQTLALATVFLTGAALIVGPPRAARAVPAPLSEDKLREESRLIVLADVLGVVCTGTSPTGHPRYAAWLQVIEAEKGESRPWSTLQFVWSAVDLRLMGAWEGRVHPGDRVKLYLVPADEPGTWKAFHPQGVVIVTRVPPEERLLPRQPGEVRFRAGRPAGASAVPRTNPPTGASDPPPS